MTNETSYFDRDQLSKLEMIKLLGGNEPAPSTLTTENVDVTNYGPFGIFGKADVHGDSYPDDCC